MVTEIASIDRNYHSVLGFTVQVINWMDKQDWIFEYGLFDFQRKVADGFVSPAAQLMDGKGNFTELGKMYVHQQPLKLPGKADISMEALVESDAESEQHPIDESDGHGNTVDEHYSIVEPRNGDEDIELEQNPVEVNDGDVVSQVGEPLLLEVGDAIDISEVNEEEMTESAAASLSPDQQKALNAHNNKRKGKGLKPLAWDAQLAKNATAYAHHLAKIGKLQHSPGNQRPNQGENLAW